MPQIADTANLSPELQQRIEALRPLDPADRFNQDREAAAVLARLEDTPDAQPAMASNVPQEHPDALPTADSTPAQASAPQEATQPPPRASRYPTWAFGRWERYLLAIHNQSQAPLCMIGTSALLSLSLALQHLADVQLPKLGTRPVSLFAFTVAESGARKSTVDGMTTRGIDRYERKLAEQRSLLMLQHQNAKLAYEVEQKKILKDEDLTQDQRTHQLNTLGAAPTPPPFTNIKLERPTMEGLEKLFTKTFPSLGVFSDDGAVFLGGHAMNRDNKTKTIASLSKCWDGKPPTAYLVGRDVDTVTDARLSLHLMFQPGYIEATVKDPQMIDQGLLSRCLMTRPTEEELGWGGRQWVEEDPNDAWLIDAMAGEVQNFIETRETQDPPQELNPRALPLSPPAKALWVAYYNQVESEQATGGAYATIRGIASKIPENAARIAALFTLRDDLNAQAVTGEAMENAIELMDFYAQEATRLVRDQVSQSVFKDTHTDEEAAILSVIEPGEEVTIRDIMQRLGQDDDDARAYENTSRQLQRMAGRGKIDRPKKGRYAILPVGLSE